MNINYPEPEEARAAIVDIGRRMYERGYVAANDGNISVRLSDNHILITPTGVSKGDLTPEMLLIVDSEGNIIKGTGCISSESPMHLCLYSYNPHIAAVVHAHPVAATAFAVARIPLDKAVYPESLVLLGDVPLAPYATPGTLEVPQSIAPFAKTHRALLLANHGVLAWGRDLREAWFRLDALENYAKIYMCSRFILNSAAELSVDEQNSILITAGEGDRVKSE